MLCRLLLVSFGLAQGLLPAVLNARPALALRARVPAMLSPAQEKKASLVEEVKAQMQTSSLLFCVRSEGITVNEMNLQRQKFPDSVKIRCVKNTLIHRAAQDFPDFEVVSKTGGELKFSNYWFFVPEEDMRATVKTWNDFIDESKREEQAIVGGVFGGDVLDAKGVEAISKLPTKQELMGQVATLLTVLPTKLGRSLNAAGAQRLARGVKEAAGTKMVRAVKAASNTKE